MRRSRRCRGGQPSLGAGTEKCLGADAGVGQVGAFAHSGENGVPELGQSDDCRSDGIGITCPDRRQSRRVPGIPDRDAGQTEIGDDLRPGVVDPEVEEHESVHPPLGRPPPIGGDLLGRLLGDVDQQAAAQLAELRLQPGEKAHEERLDTEEPAGPQALE